MNVYPNWVVRSTICHGVMQCQMLSLVTINMIKKSIINTDAFCKMSAFK